MKKRDPGFFRGLADCLAEKEGFEPTGRCRPDALQAPAFDHSATSPFSVFIIWRREWDLNPRDGSSPPRRFRVARLRPLGHPSTLSFPSAEGQEELPEHFSTFFREDATRHIAPVVEPGVPGNIVQSAAGTPSEIPCAVDDPLQP